MGSLDLLGGLPRSSGVRVAGSAGWRSLDPLGALALDPWTSWDPPQDRLFARSLLCRGPLDLLGLNWRGLVPCFSCNVHGFSSGSPFTVVRATVTLMRIYHCEKVRRGRTRVGGPGLRRAEASISSPLKCIAKRSFMSWSLYKLRIGEFSQAYSVQLLTISFSKSGCHGIFDAFASFTRDGEQCRSVSSTGGGGVPAPPRTITRCCRFPLRREHGI